MPPLIKVQLVVVVDVGSLQGLLDVHNLVPLQVEFLHHLIVALHMRTTILAQLYSIYDITTYQPNHLTEIL